MASNQQEGHSVPKSNVIAAESEEPEIKAFQEHQASAPRLSLAEEARTLTQLGSFGVISTLSSIEPKGYPSGSVVEYAADSSGKPIFSFSSLSPHTGDLRTDIRCSFTIMANGFKGLSDARVNITGTVVPITDPEESSKLREIYLARHPSSFWVEFGDFSWFTMNDIISARVIGGFARAGKVSGADYFAATPDPVAQFSAPVCGHMNQDHADATMAMIKHYVGIAVDSATMLSLDRLGVNVSCERQGQVFKCRLPFPRPAENRGSIKELIVEMTRASASG